MPRKPRLFVADIPCLLRSGIWGGAINADFLLTQIIKGTNERDDCRHVIKTFPLTKRWLNGIFN